MRNGRNVSEQGEASLPGVHVRSQVLLHSFLVEPPIRPLPSRQRLNMTKKGRKKKEHGALKGISQRPVKSKSRSGPSRKHLMRLQHKLPRLRGQVMLHPRLTSTQRKGLRDALMKRDGRCCALCACKLSTATMTIDHIIARRAGGANVLSNLRLCCAPCNVSRHDDPRGDHFVEFALDKSPPCVVVLDDEPCPGAKQSGNVLPRSPIPTDNAPVVHDGFLDGMASLTVSRSKLFPRKCRSTAFSAKSDAGVDQTGSSVKDAKSSTEDDGAIIVLDGVERSCDNNDDDTVVTCDAISVSASDEDSFTWQSGSTQPTWAVDEADLVVGLQVDSNNLCNGDDDVVEVE